MEKAVNYEDDPFASLDVEEDVMESWMILKRWRKNSMKIIEWWLKN